MRIRFFLDISPSIATGVLCLAALAMWTRSNARAENPESPRSDQSTRSEEMESTRRDYVQQLKPLFRHRCYSCHGALKQEANLRLDTVELMQVGGDSGSVVIPGKPSESYLLDRVAADDIHVRMPPEHEGEAFTAAHLQLLRDWIGAGAPAPADEQPEADPREHWAFRPRIRPEVPVVDRSSTQVRNAIDLFLAKSQEQQGVVPQDEASREVLVRRLYLDLIGLPPTMDELGEVEIDATPEWYENLVDRLLEDPRHGERWARHWMDVWRYSDWWGLGEQLRNSQKHIWHWRDWIVESLNADVPYHEMIRLMLAADELHPNDLDKLRATGYLARNYFLFNRNQWMEETVEHVGKGFLGLTLNCAKCHDHKYDPISQADFYRMRAFFEPYHVRVDVIPGQPDVEQNGIPRAYDGLLETPTYLFVRGQESQPDTSKVMEPGVPEILTYRELTIQPVSLPAEAWDPARRPWVLEAHLVSARRKLAAAEAVQPDPDELDQRQKAERDRELARAQLVAIERRADAMRASWAKEDAAGEFPDDAEQLEELEQAERTLAQVAVMAEREIEVVKARHQVEELESRLAQAQQEPMEAVEKELSAARESLEKGEQLVKEPGEQYMPLTGATWTATRFLYSTRDDPTVEFSPTSSGRRTALARWIADDDNPLTARVAANQIWMRHMGVPLAPTVFDLGRNGAPPVHTELLDWLASELVESGWSMKHLHRVIVTSAAYRRSSSLAGAESNLAKDPDNLYWWRRTPIRLESQVIRDSILSLAGTLDTTIGGPPVMPGEQESSPRRSLYFFHSNNDRNLFLTMFDEALVKECYRRDQSIVPQQALALSNSQLVHDAAGHIAKKLSEGSDSSNLIVEDDVFIQRVFLALLGIHVSDAERAASHRTLAVWREQDHEAGQGGVCERARAYLVWALLNHNDFVTLR